MMFLTYAILILSWFFIIFGMIAIFRLKNLYTRILTAATIDTVASFLVLISLIFATGQFNYGIRLVLLILFLLITNPISSHVNIRSAYLIGIPTNVKDGDVL
ncbi:MAG: monovalent cation/H(+) antiporter subunit G, partial [Acholeplasmataceae bacterium]|nr:monovalent cation/H(+) antiporter subunit G [Acholeplasmataceae bacterium]